MDETQQPSFFEVLGRFAAVAAAWVVDHEAEIKAFAVWGSILRVSEQTHLYIPAGPFCYPIAEARSQGCSPEELKALVISTFGPSGAGHETLCELLRSAPLLGDRQREVEEVLSSLSDSRYYVTICGALPLVETVFAGANGKWKHPDKYPLFDKLYADDALTDDEERLLMLNWSAVEMLQTGISDVWKSEGPRDGGPLNRNLIAHGTGRNLDTLENAVQSVLLVAAAAQVGEPLLAPRVSAS